MTPIREILSAFTLALRRRYLEHHITEPFDPKLSLELDRVIIDHEALRATPGAA